MSEHEQWFKSLNENGKTIYFLGNEHKVSKMAWDFQQVKMDELQRINAKNQNTLSHLEHEYQKAVVQLNEVLGVINEAKDGCYGFSSEGGDTDNLVKDLEKIMRGDSVKHPTR
ncbi:hypothetical protein [Acinetobacter sp. CWB-B33]|uniref:hypothetical protein n=1 Tax=Acinetobacter sp. CWB-B33 TaxID=2815724 RepID=UPI0031FF3896